MQHQPEPECLTDLHQHGSADAADLRERYRTLQGKETPLPRVRDEFSGAFDENIGEEHHHAYDRYYETRFSIECIVCHARPIAAGDGR